MKDKELENKAKILQLKSYIKNLTLDLADRDKEIKQLKEKIRKNE